MIWIVLGAIPFILFMIAVVVAQIQSVGPLGTILIWVTTAIVVSAALAISYGIGQVTQ